MTFPNSSAFPVLHFPNATYGDIISPVNLFFANAKDSQALLPSILTLSTVKELPTSVKLSSLVVIVTTYLIIARLLRFRAINRLEKRYGKTPEEFANIDYKDAQTILANLFLLEAPWLFLTSKDFAFLRAFGIRSIADVSAKAKKMIEDTGLRYSDTIVFAAEWILNPLDSERAILSLNRVNFIHSRYKDIDDAQMVYTLCLLVCEVFEWIDKYEWRTSVPLERYASYVFWKEVGIRMGIAERIIPETFEECEEFIRDFEAKEMMYSNPSERIAEGVIRLYESTLPAFLRPLFTNILISFMHPTLRSSMNLTLQTSNVIGLITTTFLPIALKFRALFVRHCMLPRMRVQKVFERTKDGERSQVVYWQMLPHYAPATFWSKWGPGALYRRAFGLAIPGPEWMSDGYKLEEVSYGGRGADKVLEVVERHKQGGCPYSTFGRVKNEGELGGIFTKFANEKNVPYGSKGT